MARSDFERRLIDNLQPVRYFALAQVLHHCMENGVFAAVDEAGGADTATLASRLGLDYERLLAVLLYLQNEGYLIEDQGWRLTAKGAELTVFAPWYTLLVGGYATTMQQLGDVLRTGAPFATRDATRVGIGSCGISEYDALPLTERLLDRSPREVTTVVDIGCGDAAFLAELLRRRAGLCGVGLEPDPGSVEIGQARSDEADLSDRLRLHHGPASDLPGLGLPEKGAGLCLLTAFVLQEILEQSGEGAVEALLVETFDAFPDAVWVVVEVDHRPTGPIMSHGLAMAYYNPYYLIHAVTEQRLESHAYWTGLFDRLGLRCLEVDYPDDAVDSTGLEIGYLLERA